MTELYGLKNCDSTRKARRWLDARGVEHRFVDVRADGVDGTALARWVAVHGWETVLNRRGTSWRKLPAQQRESVDPATALALMQANPTLIKRPVLVRGKASLVGFDAERYAAMFG